MPSTRRAILGLSSAAISPRGAEPPSLAAHAASRLMYGPRPGDVAAIEAQGFSAFLQQQLNPTGISDSACDALLAALPSDMLSLTQTQLYDRGQLTWSEAIKPFTQVRYRTVIRQASSARQLYERMVEFWHNHFNVFVFDFPCYNMWPLWDALIRQHALGNFRTFLEATATSPHMLVYLDNAFSTDGGPNENYARELFELHTLGAMNYNVPGGYEDQDVYEASRAFTGWNVDVDYNYSSATRGQFTYLHDNHDRFQKWVLGVRLPNDQPPQKDGRDVLDLLCNHMGTARHLCTKLVQKFVSDDPPPALVESAAQVWYANRTHANQIRLVLEHILSSAEFASETHRRSKFKRPVDWVISTMRALGIAYPNHDSFWWMFGGMGQNYFEWTPPNGPPETRRRWETSNSLLQRCNWVMQLEAGWYDQNGFDYSVTGLMPADRRTPREIAQWWADRIIQGPVSTATMEGLLLFLAEGRDWDIPMETAQANGKLRQLAAMCALSPEFMKR